MTPKNKQTLPGVSVRQKGDGQSSDVTVNQVYDNLAVFYQFFKEVFGRDSIDNHGKALVASVHYEQGYNNAFWNGEQMVCGDGDGQEFKEFASSLDVVAGQLTHGIVQYTA
jgi:Zn-dependent metalloprotease